MTKLFLVGADLFEALPQFDDGGILVNAGDCFLGDPLEDLDDGSIGRAHHDGLAIGYQTLGAQRRKMVANQCEQPGFGL